MRAVGGQPHHALHGSDTGAYLLHVAAREEHGGGRQQVQPAGEHARAKPGLLEHLAQRPLERRAVEGGTQAVAVEQRAASARSTPAVWIFTMASNKYFNPQGIYC